MFVFADMKLDCQPGYVTLVWTEKRALADMSLFRLGSCFPSSFSPREAVFKVDVEDCGFSRMVRRGAPAGGAVSGVSTSVSEPQVTGDVIVHSNDLVYMPLDESQDLPFRHPVVCVYPR